MENIGKASNRKRTKHMNIIYYSVTYHIEIYELSLEWCTTADMNEYFMTKPTQGMAFKMFQDQLMGFIEARDPGLVKPKKECKDQVSKYDHKSDRNVAPTHK